MGLYGDYTGTLWGLYRGIIGLIKGDTRSLDYSSHVVLLALLLPPPPFLLGLPMLPLLLFSPDYCWSIYPY